MLPHGNSLLPWGDVVTALICPLVAIAAGAFLALVTIRLAWIAVLCVRERQRRK